MYRRRRIVVFSLLAVLLALAVCCAYSLVRGFGALTGTGGGSGRAALERSYVPNPHPAYAVRRCTADDVTLSLSASASTVEAGGSVDFTATLTRDGGGSCLIETSGAGMVLTISSGDETVWRSDSCPTDTRWLLMAKGDRDESVTTWNTNRTGEECAADSSLAKVGAGTYVASMTVTDHPKVKSGSVVVKVE